MKHGDEKQKVWGYPRHLSIVMFLKPGAIYVIHSVRTVLCELVLVGLVYRGANQFAPFRVVTNVWRPALPSLPMALALVLSQKVAIGWQVLIGGFVYLGAVSSLRGAEDGGLPRCHLNGSIQGLASLLRLGTQRRATCACFQLVTSPKTEIQGRQKCR